MGETDRQTDNSVERDNAAIEATAGAGGVQERDPELHCGGTGKVSQMGAGLHPSFFGNGYREKGEFKSKASLPF